MRTQLPFTLLAAALTCSLFSVPAQAQRARTFVASYGNDNNPCTFGSPCKTFQQAVNVVAEGGEVTAIDSAGFGPIYIAHAVTITSPAGVEARIVPVSGGNAITIKVGETDAVVLRGLALNGSGIVSNGIVFNQGGSLTVTNCLVENFFSNGGDSTGNGIFIAPTAGNVKFAITDTTVSNNGNVGLYYLSLGGLATASGIIDRLVATNNFFGIFLDTSATVGAAISNSVVSNNGSFGIELTGNGGALTVSVDNTTLNGNGTGISASQLAAVMLSRSVIQGNGVGTDNQTSNTFYTYGNNLIDRNGNNFVGGNLYSGVTLR